MNGIINRIAYNLRHQECTVEIIEDNTMMRYLYREPITGNNSRKIGKSCTFELENGKATKVKIT